MTREEAINVMQKYTDTESGISKVVAEAHEMAIKSLEKEPNTDWIPVDKKPPEINCLAIDKFEQIFILKSLVSTTSDGKDRYYDGEGFSFTNGVETFLKGEEIYPGFYVLPKEVIAWMPLPKTYKESEG